MIKRNRCTASFVRKHIECDSIIINFKTDSMNSIERKIKVDLVGYFSIEMSTLTSKSKKTYASELHHIL